MSLGAIIVDVIKLGEETFSLKKLHRYSFDPVREVVPFCSAGSDDFWVWFHGKEGHSEIIMKKLYEWCSEEDHI